MAISEHDTSMTGEWYFNKFFNKPLGSFHLRSIKSHLLLCFALLALSLSLFAKNQNQLTDVNYDFGSKNADLPKDAFHFSRTYVDYFYLMIAANNNSLKALEPLAKYTGYCVGDAHPENFGILIQENGDRKFVVDDIDDFSYCPLIFDFFRLLVTTSLFDHQIDQHRMIESYLNGLSGNFQKTPKAIQQMIQESIKRGVLPNPKKISAGKINRTAQSMVPNREEIISLTDSLKAIAPGYSVIDAVETEKMSGGSSGLKRFEVLLKDKDYLHIEFKEQVLAATYPVSDYFFSTEAEKIFTGIRVEQGNNPSHLYSYTKILNKDFYVRPIYWGNINVDLSKNSMTDNHALIEFAAYSLGLIHKKSNLDLTGYQQGLSQIPKTDLEELTNSFVNFFENKFTQLQHSGQSNDFKFDRNRSR